MVVDFLTKHKNVERVIYPNIHTGEIGNRAKKYFKGGNGGLVGIELKGGVEAGKKFIDALQVCVRAISLGTVDTLVSHPASMSHYGVSPEERAKYGITDGLIRMSVGIENIEDLIADLTQALG